MADRKPPIAGKGDNRRPEDFKKIQNHWDEIPNFGFKPKWMKELDSERKTKYSKDRKI